jgi:FAD/FMN-containing dehydrogenase/Fe-S oxidoreductase
MLNQPSDTLVKPVRFVDAGRASATPLAQHLRRELRGDVMFDRAARGRYATDASIYQIMPIGVVVPRDQDDLIVALDVARHHAVPVLARGAGTSQCGQTVGDALVIDTSKWLHQVLAFDAQARTVTVEPGLVLDHLNAWLKPHGLWFPVDVSTAAQCTIGGMTGNNSCGSRSIEYGNMVHNVVGIDAVLADGYQARFTTLDAMAPDTRLQALVASLKQIAQREAAQIIEQVPKVLRRVAGYNIDVFDCQNPKPYSADGMPNLAHLLVGSEGTLAFSRQITLRLAPLPAHKVLGVVNFASFHQAMDLTQHIVKLGPTAVELVDHTMIALSITNPAFRAVIEGALVGTPQAILLVEFAGADAAVQLAKLAQLDELMDDLGLPGSVVRMTGAAQQKALWEVRKAGLNIMMSMKGDGKPVSFIEDCAVPLEHLAEYTASLTEVFHRHGTEGTWYAHASVGTLHVRPILDMRRDGAQKMRAIAEEASALVRQFKGAYSGEHGDGLCRGEWVAWQYGPRLNQAFKDIKNLFDPDNRFNPDKIVNPPKMDDVRNFRFGANYGEVALTPRLDWSSWNVTRAPLTGAEGEPGSGGDRTGGLAKAVEMCNNNGHCRKFDAGTMCPSYRVTRDEMHVTRGRANTLRLALSGQLGSAGLASPEVKEALDLCVSCKGCKRDCPTGVDMAKIKIEARAAWQDSHGLTLRERLVAFMPHYAPLASRLSPLVDLLKALPLPYGWAKRQMGFATERSLPSFKPSFLGRRGASASLERASKPASGDKQVLLFVDTFNNYFEPENAAAAKRVLEAAGYHVHLNKRAGERPLCCGRTLLSAGLVAQAREEAQRMLDGLLPYIEQQIPIVGLEPSCLLTLRDEFLNYGFGEPARKLAQSAFLFEEFLVRESEAGRLKLDLGAIAQTKALIHGHCHQKAFDVLGAIPTVLKWIPGLEVSVIESSCCGMAGNFGYEAEHYQTSMAMAELALLPAVREIDDHTVVVADGTSCRHQIADGAQTNAVHVAVLLASALSSTQ